MYIIYIIKLHVKIILYYIYMGCRAGQGGFSLNPNPALLALKTRLTLICPVVGDLKPNLTGLGRGRYPRVGLHLPPLRRILFH